MGGMKELLFDIEAERFDEWLEENHPDVVPGSKEWEHAANLYYWEQEALADQAQWDHEHGLFVASLNNVHQRCLHASQELKKLYALLDEEQPELVYRMSFVHAVTVMESYLMYCAGPCWNMTGPQTVQGCVLPEVQTNQKSGKHAARDMPLFPVSA